jgi:DNA-binding NarL/FixJ family response regulator
MTRILIVEDHLIVQEALVALLRTRSDLQIVGAAPSIRETMPLLDSARPDILLLDLSLEDGSGLELARTLYRSRSRTRVLVMTGFGDRFAAKEAMAAGVAGYLLKTQSAADLFAAIDVIRQGGRYVAPTIAAQLSADELTPQDTSPLESLSHRESEIFRLLVAGTSSKELAQRLFISVKTVETHRTNIARKLGVRSSVDLVRFAAAQGIAIAPSAAGDSTVVEATSFGNETGVSPGASGTDDLRSDSVAGRPSGE